jgi:hypothetical protein
LGIFPRFPEQVPPDLTRATSRYKRHAWLAFLGLVLFVGLYVGLAGWFAWTAYRCAVDLVHGGNGVADFFGGAVSALLAVFLLKALLFIKRSPSCSRTSRRWPIARRRPGRTACSYPRA